MEQRRRINDVEISEHPVIADIYNRLDKGDERFSKIGDELNENTRTTMETRQAVARIEYNTSDLTTLLIDLRSGTRLLCRIALGISWMLDTMKKYGAMLLVLYMLIWFILFGTVPQWAIKALKLLGF